MIAALLYAIGQGTGQTALQSACMKVAGPDRRGVAASTFFLGADMGQGIGPMIGGAISQKFGYKTMFISGITPLMIGILLFGFYLYHRNKKELEQLDELSENMI